MVLPLVVISELEGKRHHPELGGFARQALRILDDLRVEHGRLDQPLAVNDEGGTLRVELNHADRRCCRSGSGPTPTTRGSCRWRWGWPPRAATSRW